METIKDVMKEYQKQLQKGWIQKAYGEIMGFMNGLRTHLKRTYPEDQIGGLYQWYMDMTYFSFTPRELKERNLRIAVVYLHQENLFEAWLTGVNRSEALKTMEKLKMLETYGYEVFEPVNGVDYIIRRVLSKTPDFEEKKKLMDEIERKCLLFRQEMTVLMDQIPSENRSGKR